MSRVRVKICGITRLEDALASVELGADALGFNFWPRSKRFIEPAAARAIVDRLPPFVTAVGVFVDARPGEVLAAAARSGVRALQLHGDEDPAEVNAYELPTVKALRLAGPDDLELLLRYRVSGFLVDAPSQDFGGSGLTCDWRLAREAARRATVILAGGLNPDNVAQAVREVGPYGVDVASGVESAPGVKDHRQLQRFIAGAKEETR
jgi:phosphoribosylanthranilate isomerase